MTELHSLLAFLTISQRKRHYKVCKSSNMQSYLCPTQTKIYTLLFDRFSKIFKTKFLIQTLISQPNMNQIKPFVDQNLSWLIVNQKQL